MAFLKRQHYKGREQVSGCQVLGKGGWKEVAVAIKEYHKASLYRGFLIEKNADILRSQVNI